MRIVLGVPMVLSDIANASGGELLAKQNSIIYSVTTDTRELYAGDLFIALSGDRFDGESYVKDAKKQGAFVISKNRNDADIFAPDTRLSLLKFAEKYAENLPIILYKIGITGSVGKTTTKEFLGILLHRQYKCHLSKGNFNNEIGMPMSILSAPPDTEILVMEMGMNHPGEISRLSRCLKPDIAIITNVGSSHIGNLGSRESIAKAKLEICDGMSGGVTVVPHDEPLLKSAKGKKTFSLSKGLSDYSLVANEENEISIFQGSKLYGKSRFLPEGEHHKYCLAAAASAAIEAGVAQDSLAEGIHSISIENTRQNVFCLEKYEFYTDFYNASFESVIALLQLAEDYKKGCRKSLVLGDILELGRMSSKIHFDVGKSISPLTFSNLFLYGKECVATLRGAIDNGFPSERIFVNPNITDPSLTADQIRAACSEGEIIFMKASRDVRLENVLNCFGEGRKR